MFSFVSPPDGWPEPNYYDPETRGNGLLIINIVFTVFGLAAVLLRLYSRYFLIRSPGLDDALIVVAVLFAVAMSITVGFSERTCFLGYHLWDIRPENVDRVFFTVWLGWIWYMFAATFTKISILLFYRRLTINFSKVFLIATWIGIVYNVCWLVANIFIMFVGCRPIEAYWNTWDSNWLATHEWQCIDGRVALIASAALSVFGDLYAAIIPMLLLRYLRVPMRQKIMICLVFATAFFIVAVGVLRTIKLAFAVLVDGYDYTWDMFDFWIWSIVEMYLGIFCASAPALKIYFPRLAARASIVTGYRVGGPRSSMLGSVGGGDENKDLSIGHRRSKSGRIIHLDPKSPLYEEKKFSISTFGDSDPAKKQDDVEQGRRRSNLFGHHRRKSSRNQSISTSSTSRTLADEEFRNSKLGTNLMASLSNSTQAGGPQRCAKCGGIEDQKNPHHHPQAEANPYTAIPRSPTISQNGSTPRLQPPIERPTTPKSPAPLTNTTSRSAKQSTISNHLDAADNNNKPGALTSNPVTSPPLHSSTSITTQPTLKRPSIDRSVSFDSSAQTASMHTRGRSQIIRPERRRRSSSHHREPMGRNHMASDTEQRAVVQRLPSDQAPPGQGQKRDVNMASLVDISNLLAE